MNIPRNDLIYSRARLDKIMTRKRLSFNPYTVSDERLLEIVSEVGWGNEWDIVEMVTVSFTRLREVRDYRKFDGIFMELGNSSTECFLPLGALTFAVTALDTLQPERSWVGKRAIRNAEDVKKLVGNRYFVSRVIRGMNIFRSRKNAYHFHRLTGNTQKDARKIREAMCASKIEMLERILSYPEASIHLDCVKGLFNYETRIKTAIGLIRNFPNIT